jgi:hypothetical protein
VAAVGGLLTGIVLAGGVAVADPSVINDVRTGVYQLFDEADQRNTATGRQFGDDLARLNRYAVRVELEQAVDCINSWHSGEPVFNDYCPLEEAPPVDP